MNNFEQKISEIQGDIEKNHKTIEEIKDAVRKLSNGDKKSVDRLKVSFRVQGFVSPFFSLYTILSPIIKACIYCVFELVS